MPHGILRCLLSLVLFLGAKMSYILFLICAGTTFYGLGKGKSAFAIAGFIGMGLIALAVPELQG